MVNNIKLIRSRLENEKKRLLEVLEQTAASAPDSGERREGSPFGKREEEATQSMELEKRLALEKRVRNSLADVEHALEKIDNGTYGLCDSCGAPIGEERLEALPYANLCVACKAKNVKSKTSAT